MVRRTACHDVNRKHRTGKRVQFRPADSQIRARMGLIDSIPTLDLLELESAVTPKFSSFRDAAVRGNCKTPIVDGNREYRCARVTGTPLTVGFVINRKRRVLELDRRVERLQFKENRAVGDWPNGPALCSEFLSANEELDRFESLLDLAEKKADCLPERAAQMLPTFAQAVQEWRSAWTPPDENATLNSCPRPADFKDAHRSSFVEFAPGVVSFFPTCEFAGVRAFFGNQPQLFEISSDEKAAHLDVEVNPDRHHLLTVHRGLVDSTTGRLIARAGVQWSAEYAAGLWKEGAERDERQKICGGPSTDCFLLSADVFVVASSNEQPPTHLSALDPALFEALMNKSVIKRKFTSIDYQAACPIVVPRFSPNPNQPTSDSPRPSTSFQLLQKVVQLAYSWFTFDLFHLLPTESKVFYTEGECHFKVSPTVERCVLAQASYRVAVAKPTTVRVPVHSDCFRSATVIPGTDRVLSLLILEGECKKKKKVRSAQKKTPVREFNFKPTRIPDCSLVKRRPRLTNPMPYAVDELQRNETECSSSSSSSGLQTSAFVLLFVLIRSLL
ncbi:Voltage-dependent calcium channel subunit alpha-2/delta-2 [Aphelenchoides fujianensis]|nr:Voltage-dependent calcium channel subunit alpha-2/delta-2 [Aphelenchoides fujianensis]